MLIKQLSEEELRLILDELCLDGNCTAYLMIPMPNEGVISSPRVDAGMEDYTCDCFVDYSSEPRDHSCCKDDYKHCPGRCDSICTAVWDLKVKKWSKNMCGE
jgi:hypothetical protein